MPAKLIGGAMGGVFVPIVIEFGAKGAKIDPKFPYKWSGVIGVVGGGVPIIAYFAKKDTFERMKPDNRDAILAFSASMFATGASILILDELRKSQNYQFNVPLGPNSEGLTAPASQVIKEI
jgi:hypothetical protein